jgi:membrane dipeptidase
MATLDAWDHPRFSQAQAVLDRVGLLDLHLDSILQQVLFRYDVRKAHGAGRPGQPLFWHADLPRMFQAGYAGACMGIHWWPWESERGWRAFHRQVDYLDQIASDDPGAMRVHGPAGWLEHAADPRCRLIPGVEGAHILNGRLDRVEELARRGVAYLTLTHFSRNAAATPAMGRGENEVDGLTPFGLALVDELNRAGIVVDVAHVNHAGVMDACGRSKAPVLATHSGARSLHDHRRLLRDDAIEAVVATGGAVGVIFAPRFLSGVRTASSEIVVDHIEYIAERFGVQHVAIGTDYDGWLDAIPSDQRDCRDVVRVVDRLLARGWSDPDLHALLRGNVERVFRGVVDTAERLTRPAGRAG